MEADPMKGGKLELVTWRDAHFIGDMETDKPKRDYLCQTVGWVTEEKGGKFLRITSEHTPDADRAVTRVPVTNIIKRKRLK